MPVAKPDWDPSEYEAVRPTYDQETYDRILRFYGSEQPEHVLDLGCGTGLFTRGLPPRCSRLTAMDPEQDMVEQAQKSMKDTKTRAGHPVEFKHSGAEELDSFADGSVDVITAATAAHWFPGHWWTGAYRVLKSGGIVALCTYTTYAISTARQPLSAEDDNITQINDAVKYIIEDDVFSPRPGNKIVSAGYRGLAGPQEPGWSQQERQEWLYVRDEKQITFDQLWMLLLTASHIRAWVANHPDIDPETSPLEQAKQKIANNWPKDGRPVYQSLPMALLLWKKLS